MKRRYTTLLIVLFTTVLQAQTVLINAHFDTNSALTDLAGLVTTGGTITLSPTKAADGVCSQGMVQVNSGGGFLQVNVPSCSVITLNMKSTASARTVKVSFQKQGDTAFTILTSALTVNTAAAFDFHTLFPAIVSATPISVKIEPISGNIQIHDLYVVSSSVASTAAEITAFSLPNQMGNATINSTAATISVNMPLATNLTAVVPTTLSVSTFATVNPTPSVSRDFSNPVTYTVTAQDGVTKKTWTITARKVASPEKDITAFQLSPNQIGSSVINAAAGTIAVSMPVSSVLTSLVPTNLTISALANINPTPSVSRDFSRPVIYTVAAQDGSTKTWTITVSLIELPNHNFNFNKVVGYAAMAGDGFAGPTVGGQNTTQPTLCINGPADFNKLCEVLYYRQRAYANKTPTNGLSKAPLIILIKAGVYDASQTLSTIGANAYANYMLDIAEQGDLTFLGEGNVVFKFGINVKRSYNIIIRNISFYDYHDDGVNVGYPETHHVWIDHCTFGHPTTLPVDPEDPDGTSEVKDGASFVTISWCKYRNHWKTCLLGHSDNNGATDLGRLKVTYYANYFYSTNSRHPRTRFGTVHVLNNLYENVGLGRTGGLGYGIGASNNSQVWAEGNFFLDTRWPMTADRSTADFAAIYGANLVSPNSNTPCYGLKSVNNEYDDSGLTQSLVGKVAPAMLNASGLSIKFDELTTPNFTYNPINDYNYTADLLPASAVRTLIPIYAGADKINWNIGCTTPVGVADNESVLNNLKITPSVSSDFLTIETISNETATLTVVDVFGRMVITQKITASENRLKISNLPNGVYSVVLSNSSGRSVGKFIKQ